MLVLPSSSNGGVAVENGGVKGATDDGLDAEVSDVAAAEDALVDGVVCVNTLLLERQLGCAVIDDNSLDDELTAAIDDAVPLDTEVSSTEAEASVDEVSLRPLVDDDGCTVRDEYDWVIDDEVGWSGTMALELLDEAKHTPQTNHVMTSQRRR